VDEGTRLSRLAQAQLVTPLGPAMGITRRFDGEWVRSIE
jgi:hypothetical protein